ncbi:hypothetical protein [Streptomyces sp. NPDC007205]|uniref:hypothetical protein n=1 Tax=Streptomyces sp. NPDC007205 TaxID=3154316 RepID=UPI0033E91795
MRVIPGVKREKPEHFSSATVSEASTVADALARIPATRREDDQELRAGGKSGIDGTL